MPLPRPELYGRGEFSSQKVLVMHCGDFSFVDRLFKTQSECCQEHCSDNLHDGHMLLRFYRLLVMKFLDFTGYW